MDDLDYPHPPSHSRHFCYNMDDLAIHIYLPSYIMDDLDYPHLPAHIIHDTCVISMMTVTIHIYAHSLSHALDGFTSNMMTEWMMQYKMRCWNIVHTILLHVSVLHALYIRTPCFAIYITFIWSQYRLQFYILFIGSQLYVYHLSFKSIVLDSGCSKCLIFFYNNYICLFW